MVNAIMAALSLWGASAAASSLSVGTAHVINKCTYDVYLCNVPASGGGYEEKDQTLSAGESWEQDWTSLSNGDGWSIKLSKSQALENILQYEYTFHEDGIIWYDLSCVNGNPWDANWEITSSTDTCNPKQQAYRYATDDAYGMQSCPQDASITVTLCSGEDNDNSTSSAAPAPTYESTTSLPAYTEPTTASPTPTSTTEVYSATEASPTTTASSSHAHWYNWNDADMSASLAADKPTTFATQTTAVVELDGATITEVETAVVTAVVTAYGKRHEHHPRGHRRHA